MVISQPSLLTLLSRNKLNSFGGAGPGYFCFSEFYYCISASLSLDSFSLREIK
uniref:Uncharacterized protein n=1 Tax=Anguilla anguilla TaxID=7936 RepID=A0A0E9VSY4_ANGAN